MHTVVSDLDGSDDKNVRNRYWQVVQADPTLRLHNYAPVLNNDATYVIKPARQLSMAHVKNPRFRKRILRS
jgi:hypothetical protein